MDLYETLLFFHVLGGFSLVAGTISMAPFALGWGGAALDRLAAARLATLGAILSGVGALLTIVLGLWLVGNVGYELLRLWILGALVFWGVAGFANGKVASAARNVRKGDDAGLDVKKFWAMDILGAALIVALMLYKPGA